VGVVSARDLRTDAIACHAAALAAVAPEHLVAARLGTDADGIVLRAPSGAIEARHAGPVLLVGAGKAALAMARAALAVVGEISGSSLVIVPHGTPTDAPPNLDVCTASHPVPDGAGAGATARLLAAVTGAGPDTLVIMLLSGGASALLVAPAPGLTITDKQAVTRSLLAAGADITALNTVRKHCSRVKGGALARAAARAAGLWTLVLSDVVGDDLATIASGPTVADPSTYADAAAVLDRYLKPDDASVVRRHLARGCSGAVPETVKPGDPALERVRTVIVGGNRDAVRAAAAAAAARGYATTLHAEPLVGDAAVAGRLVASRLLAARRDRPVAIVAGGETTVRVSPDGRGGRAQHLALAASISLAGTPAVVLAAGTDGVDGPTDAAGACVDGGTVARARGCGLDAAWALATTDAYPLLDATGDLLRTGPTGTNVADVVVALRDAW
jgi:glycerate-2-kinase